MEIDRTESLATAGAPQNGSSRIWVESVSAGMRTVEAMIRELSQNDVPMLVVAEHGSFTLSPAARPSPFTSIRGRKRLKKFWLHGTVKVEPSIFRKWET